MKIKCIFLCFTCIAFIRIGNAQVENEIDSTILEQISFFEKLSYEFGSQLYSKNKLYYKTKEDFVMPWGKVTKLNRDNLLIALDSVAENAKVNIVNDSFTSNQLQLTSHFPSNITDVQDIFEVTIFENNLLTELDQPTIIDSTGSTFFGNQFSSKSKNGNTVYKEWINFTTSFTIENEEEIKALHGSIKFTAQFISDYEYSKITINDIGKQFSLDSVNYTVMDIVENFLIIKPDVYESLAGLNFDFFNLDANNKELAQIPYFDLVKMQKNDSTIDLSVASGVGKSTIYENVFSLFKANPSLTLEEFRAQMHDNYIALMQSKKEDEAVEKYLGATLIVVQTVAPIQNMYLYKPVYNIKNTFEVKM